MSRKWNFLFWLIFFIVQKKIIKIKCEGVKLIIALQKKKNLIFRDETWGELGVYGSFSDSCYLPSHFMVSATERSPYANEGGWSCDIEIRSFLFSFFFKRIRLVCIVKCHPYLINQRTFEKLMVMQINLKLFEIIRQLT